MEKNKQAYLTYVDFTQLVSWSSYALLGKNLIYTQKYSFVRIGDFLKRNKEQVQIEDCILYKRPTIRINGNGINLRDEVKGKNIGTKNQFRIYKDQFLLSKIDARNGAFGVVPLELDKGIITGNFWTFDVDYSIINPHYLTRLTGTKEFQKLCQNASVGTTNRNYLQEDLFLNFEIPLPSLEEQEKLVKNYNDKINEAERLTKLVKDLEIEIENYIYKELGLTNNIKTQKVKGLSFVNFVNLSRWDTNFLFQKEYENVSKYPLVPYNNIFERLNNGIPARNYTRIGVRFLKVADIKSNYLDDTKVKYIQKFNDSNLIEENTLLITRKGTVGNSYFVTENNIFTASSEIFIIKLNEKVSGNYLAEINELEFVKKQYKEKNTGTIMPSLSQDKLKEILVPLPPIEKQIEIEQKIKIMKYELKKYSDLVKKTKENAIQEFENEIFGGNL